MHNVYAVILIFNKVISDSLTYNCISRMRLSNLHILILDNSTKDFNNEKYSIDNNLMYLNMGGNKGLSIPYNKAIDFLFSYKKMSDNDYIVWLDDDTELSSNYFNELFNKIKSYPSVDIFAPVVYGQDGIIYSPNNARYIKNNLVRNRKECFNLKKYNAINSCLCVKASIYSNYRYDEGLFLDQTDQKFFDDMRLYGCKFMTLDVNINQNFSQRGEKLDPKKMLFRYKIRVADIMNYGRKSFYRLLLAFIKAFGLSAQIAIKTRSFKLFLICTTITLKKFFIHFANLFRKGKLV